MGISEQAAQIWKQRHRWECTSAVDRNRRNLSDHDDNDDINDKVDQDVKIPSGLGLGSPR